MFAAGAAILWLVARAFRRGLNAGTAIGIGAAVGFGVLMKATLVGLAPGLLVALVMLLVKADGSQRRRTLRFAAVALAVAAVPIIAYVALNATVWDRPLWSAVPGTDAATGGRPAQLREFLSYLWQFYLPRLPFMNELQSGLPVYNVWFKGFVGRFGWLDTTFPGWVYTVAAGSFGVVFALAAAGFWRARDRLARRWNELLAYAALMAGFLVVVGWAGYSGRLANGYIFEQSRYLLPLGALYAAFVALAVRGAGERLGRAVGASLVVLACGHLLMSMLLVVGRFYA
jgi:4-amino-4-deoxy-L-arabinose transferase-like glycosyltransferase